MSFDLKILILGQNEPTNFHSTIDIISEDQEQLRYQTIWRFMSSMKGIMYSLGKTYENMFNAMSLIDTSFDNPKEYPYWITDEDVISNLTPMRLQKEYEVELKKLLKQMLQHSPINMIMFMTRYQGGDTEILCGTIKLSEFLDYIEKDKILFNVCYIIENDETSKLASI